MSKGHLDHFIITTDSHTCSMGMNGCATKMDIHIYKNPFKGKLLNVFFFFYGNVLVFLKTIDRLQFRCSMKTKSSWILGGQQKILEFYTHNLKHLTTAALDISNKTKFVCFLSHIPPGNCFAVVS